jgi:hypothetical protein
MNVYRLDVPELNYILHENVELAMKVTNTKTYLPYVIIGDVKKRVLFLSLFKSRHS